MVRVFGSVVLNAIDYFKYQIKIRMEGMNDETKKDVSPIFKAHEVVRGSLLGEVTEKEIMN